MWGAGRTGRRRERPHRDGRVGEVQRQFNVQWVPTLVLLDRQGAVLFRGGASEAGELLIAPLLR